LITHLTTMAEAEAHISEVRTVLAEMAAGEVERAIEVILVAYRHRRHVYIIGNGGSASTASHFACDLSKATVVGDQPRLRVTALTDNVALLTAWANDSSYEAVFAEQLTNLLDPGDVVVAISASGKSPNVIAAIGAAQRRGAVTVGMVGFTGGPLKKMVDVAVHVHSHSYGVVEDCHSVVQHAITAAMRGALADGTDSDIGWQPADLRGGTGHGVG
jgi:D-sedoheptulose 7-phosphate isomerase